MKRIIIFAALAAFALTSCQQDITFEENKPEGLVFTATTEIPATKTALDASLNVVWQAGDEIVIVDGDSYIGTYTTTASGDTKATFTRHSGSEATSSPYSAWYPTSLFSGTTFVLPATQSYVAGNISGNPMYAESSTTNLSFKNLCGIIKLNISTTQTGKKVRRIVLSADQGMSGEISNAATLATDLAAVVSGTAGVTLDCGTEGVEIGSTPTPFYIVVPAADYENLAITVETTDGLQQTKKLKIGEKVSVTRSRITDISLTFNDFALYYDITSSNDEITIPSGVPAILTGRNNRRNVIIEGGNSIITLEDATTWKLNVNGDATIMIKGENTIDPYDNYANPIFIKEGTTVTFQGDGSLTAQASYESVLACENNNADIIIESGTYNLTSVSYSTQTISAGNLTINGGTVNADCSAGFYNAIYATKTVSITNGVVNARGRAQGIYVNGGDLIISGGSVTAEQTGTNFDSGNQSKVAGIGINSSDGTNGGTLTISGGTVKASGKAGPGIGTSWYRSGWSESAITRSILISGGTVIISTEKTDHSAIGYYGFGNPTRCDAITITKDITSLTLIQGATATRMFTTGDVSAVLTVDEKDMSGYFSDPTSIDWNTLPNLQRTVTTTTAENDTWTFTPKS